MTTSDLYGSRRDDIEALRSAAERALGVKFQLHEYDWYGGDYLRTPQVGTEFFLLLHNRVVTPDGDEILEPEFPGYAVLLRVAGTERADEIRVHLTGIDELDHLRRKVR
jgi:hypothetical protein